jgi:hypothetical protein
MRQLGRAAPSASWKRLSAARLERRTFNDLRHAFGPLPAGSGKVTRGISCPIGH